MPEKPVMVGYVLFGGVMMTRIALAFILAFTCMSMDVSAGKSTVRIAVGGVWRSEINDVGYNAVAKVVTAEKSTITCYNPGYEKCPKAMLATGPNRPADDHTVVEDAAMDYAQAQIASNVLSGNMQFTISGNSNVKRLIWTASSSLNETG
jgi:hypothetical protein